MAEKTSAFAQMSAYSTGSIYTDPKNPYVFFAQATDPVRKAQALQDIARSLSAQPGPAGYQGSQLSYIQQLMRKSKISKSTTPLGQIGLDESSALEKVILASIASNVDPLTFLEDYTTSLKPKTIAQPDTTTKYTKQIQSALQLKDLGDSRQAYSDAYFKAYGQFPPAELDKRFQEAWNNEVKKQLQPTTTEGKVEYAPIYDTKSKAVIDPKTKKQKVDKFGNKVFAKIKTNDEGVKQYKTITTGATTSRGEGFTAEEQTQFLADFLVENFPEASWTVEDIGGTAKTLYDSIKATALANYQDAPTLPEVSALIKNIMSSPDEKVQAEMYRQYTDELAKKSTGRFMAIQNLVQPGETASKYVDPLLKSLSNALETEITVKDQLAIKALNFKGEDGTYRLPNDFELNQMVMSDSRFDKTSGAINTAVNMAQTLKNALR
jgi:hypothetical protein